MKAFNIPQPTHRLLEVSEYMYDTLIPLMLSKCAYNAGHYTEGLHATNIGLVKNPTDSRFLHNLKLYQAQLVDAVAANIPREPQLVTTLSTRRRSICIYAGYSNTPWSPATYAISSLGGSETAAMWLAHSFAARGHNVSVTGGVVSGLFEGVLYVSQDATESYLLE